MQSRNGPSLPESSNIKITQPNKLLTYSTERCTLHRAIAGLPAIETKVKKALTSSYQKDNLSPIRYMIC